jgi:hypothetical protein
VLETAPDLRPNPGATSKPTGARVRAAYESSAEPLEKR